MAVVSFMFYIFNVFSYCFEFMLTLYYNCQLFIDLYLVLVYKWYFVGFSLCSVFARNTCLLTYLLFVPFSMRLKILPNIFQNSRFWHFCILYLKKIFLIKNKDPSLPVLFIKLQSFVYIIIFFAASCFFINLYFQELSTTHWLMSNIYQTKET